MTKNLKKFNIIFIGTPDFSVPTLLALINDERFNVMAVITAPDAKVGRKQIMTPPPVKVVAKKFYIKILQPEKISSTDVPPGRIYSDADVVVTIAYGQIIPKEILEMPKFGCLNLHASLLPKYRGASPIQSAIAAGETETGVTMMKMDEGCDTGPIIAQEKIKINQYDFQSSCHSRKSGNLEINNMDSRLRGNDNLDTGESLHNKLAQLSAAVIIKYLEDYLKGKLKPQPQNNSQATKAPKLTRESGKINWDKSAAEIERLTRAYYPWPGAWTELNGKKLKIISASLPEGDLPEYRLQKKPGAFFKQKNQLAVQCGKDVLIINKLQPEGKKVMSAQEFLAGHKI